MSSEEARRSINGAPVVKPTTDAFSDDELQKKAVNIAISAFENNSVEKDVAEHIKKEFNKRHGPTWHCIVGRNFERVANFQWRCNQRHHRDQELEKQNPWLGSASSLAYQFL
ncbi:hypothetical protein GQ457_15G014930 [Hibiscus cannabinus]